MNQAVYSNTYYASAGESNPEQELSLTTLITQIIDIATLHANQLGIGNPAMAHLNAGWVLSRLTVEMTRYPEVNTQYTLSTWIESWNRRFSQRAFSICDPDGNIIGYARSIWMVLNTLTREGVSLEHLNLDQSLISENLVCPIRRQAKHIPILPMGSTPLHGELVATAPAKAYQIKYCDIDYYRHVNTVRYVAMLLNQFSLQDFDKAFAQRIEMSFLHEARYGMPLEILRHDTPAAEETMTTAFSIADSDNRQPLLFARLFLKSRR